MTKPTSPEPRTCIVNGCPNQTDQGRFVGDLCSPCYHFVADGEGVHSQAFRNALVAAATVNVKVAGLEHVHGALQDDRIEIFPPWKRGT